MSRKKRTVVVIFGGQSSEHEVSCVSAVTIIRNLDLQSYEPLLIGITKAGIWKKVDSIESIRDGSWRDGKVSALISPDRSRRAVLFIHENEVEAVDIDVVFPALHGLYGEDGTLQGLLELAGVPYVGCGVLASAISMDKYYTKQLVERLGIRQARCLLVTGAALRRWEVSGREAQTEVEAMTEDATDGSNAAEESDEPEFMKNFECFADEVEARLGYPVFVKPSNAGSSCGVTKVHNRSELLPGLQLAAQHDRRILVEEGIVGRELECAVFGGGSKGVKASGIGEILPAAEFYDYDAKYNSEDSKTVLSPALPNGKEEEIRKAAVRIFRALDEYGLSRVDFFLEDGTNEVVFNEINTLPGFTSISMYPMLWEAKGVSKKELVSRLLELAYQRE